jgi:TatA/E family protein of Tat protein translocase
MNPLFALGMPGMQEWLVIAVVALVVFGPRKLPEIARTLGRSVQEFRKAKDEFTAEFDRPSAGNSSPSEKP